MENETKSKEFVVVCSKCNKIKISERVWVTNNLSVTQDTHENVSHGICPECAQILYPEYN